VFKVFSQDPFRADFINVNRAAYWGKKGEKRVHGGHFPFISAQVGFSRPLVCLLFW
jgi:hypothetical protein